MAHDVEINEILEVLPDGRFVVVYNTDEIITLNLNGPVPDLSGCNNHQECFLAGVAFARLNGTDFGRPKVVTVDTEEL